MCKPPKYCSYCANRLSLDSQVVVNNFFAVQKISDELGESPDLSSSKNYQLIQEKKTLFFQGRAAQSNLPTNSTLSMLSITKPRSLGNKHRGFGRHPEITSKNIEYPLTVLLALTGKNREEVLEEIGEDEENLTQRFRDYLKNNLKFREDKKFVSIDLEVAAPSDLGVVDQGEYSNILEVGFLVWDSKTDTIETEVSELFNVPEDFRTVYGTGWEEAHHISVYDVAEKPLFSEDRGAQRKLLDTLCGNVLVAHNASFEISQLSHNLPGFAAAFKEGAIEVLDTLNVCKFFIPEAKANTNQAFIESQGGEYLDAHRALSDAKMTFTALKTLVNKQK